MCLCAGESPIRAETERDSGREARIRSDVRDEWNSLRFVLGCELRLVRVSLLVPINHKIDS